MDIFDRIMDLKIFSIFRPFYKKNKEVLLYLFFGGLTTIVSIAVFALFGAFLNPLLANIISWIVAVVFAYMTNRTWVFQSKASDTASLGKECAAFFGGRISTLVMEELVLLAGINLLHIHPLVVKLIAQVLVVIGNYFISKLLVFREKN